MYLLATPDGSQAVNLIKEDNAGLMFQGLFKEQSQLTFSLSHPPMGGWGGEGTIR